MLRLLRVQGFPQVYSQFVACCVTKRQKLLIVPVCHDRDSKRVRFLSTGLPGQKDALQPRGDKPDVDLDSWKSVMRSKAASEERRDVCDDEDDGRDHDEKGGSSSLEATRELVVMWRHAGKMVPEEMKEEEVEALAKLSSKSARKKYLKFLAIKEGLKKSHREKQQRKKEQRIALLEQVREERGDAQVLRNTFLLKYWNSSLDRLLAWRSAQAMQFNQPLVIDFSYESNMARRELENTVSQLLEVEGRNRGATEPYHLHYCNLQPGGAYHTELLKRYGAETWNRLFITTTDKQHFEVFPRERLVYLTADSRNVLRTYDHSKVYVIGAMVDRSIQQGVSLANAKRLKLETARLPLDQFLHWEMGAKNLTLDQMIRIMHTFKETGSWEEALEFVPKRKHDGFHQQRNRSQEPVFHNKGRGVANRTPGEEDRHFQFRSEERTFKKEDQSLYRTQKEPRFAGRDRDRMAAVSGDRENKAAVTKVRSSFMSNMERRQKAGKPWWDKE